MYGAAGLNKTTGRRINFRHKISNQARSFVYALFFLFVFFSGSVSKANAVAITTTRPTTTTTRAPTVQPATPQFPTAVTLSATNSSIYVVVGRTHPTCFNASIKIVSNVSYIAEEKISGNVTANVTHYRLAVEYTPFIPEHCGAVNATVKVLAIVPHSPAELVWFSNASLSNFSTTVTVTRTSSIPLPLAPYSMSFYHSGGSVDIFRNVSATTEVPLHNLTAFYWQIRDVEGGGADCGLVSGRTFGNKTIVSPKDGVTRLIQWLPTCVMNATLFTNTTYHGLDPYYDFAPISIRVRQCYVAISHPPIIYYGASPPDVLNVTIPSDLPTSVSILTTLTPSTPPGGVATLLAPSNFRIQSDSPLSMNVNITGIRLEPYNTISATFTGYPSRCLPLFEGFTSFKIQNQTFFSARLLPQQYYFTQGNITFEVSSPTIVSSDVYVGCAAPVITVSYAYFSPLSSLTSALVCTSATNGTVSFKFEIKKALTPVWRSFNITPSMINVQNIQLPIGVNVVMFQPAVLLYGEQSGSDNQNSVAVSLTRGSYISASIVVTISASPALGLSTTTLMWAAGESGRKTVVVRAVAEATNGNLTFSVASFDGSGRPTQETAGNFFSPARFFVISINTKAPVFAALRPNWDVLTQGRPLEIEYSVGSSPIGELRITPTGTALRYVSVSPSELVINSSLTVARATIMPLLPTIDEVDFALLNVTFSGSAAPQFIIAPASTVEIVVRPRLRIESSMQHSHLSNAAEIFDFYLEESPLPGTVLTVALSCLRDGISQMIFSPPTLTWTSTSKSIISVRSMAVFETGVGGVNCTGAIVGGNATGYAPFVRNIAIRDPKPILFTYPTGRFFPGEEAKVTINTQFTVAKPVIVHVSCQWEVDANGPSPTFGGSRYDDPLAGDESLYSCDRYVVEPVVTVPQNDPSRLISYAAVRVPPLITKIRNVVLTLRIETDTTDITLPEGNMSRGTITLRPRRWVNITGVPDAVFEGDVTTVLVELETAPDASERLFVKIEGNPSLEFDRTSAKTKNVTLMIPASGGILLVNLSATSDAQANRYTSLVEYLEIKLYPKLKVSTTYVWGPQVLGDENAQTFDITFSRSPLLRGCDVAPAFASPVASLVAFNPPLLYWIANPYVAETSKAVTQRVRVIGLSPGVASEMYFLPECDQREIDPTSRRVTFASTFETIPLKTITLSSEVSNLTRIIAGELNSQILLVQLSSPPSGRSRLVLSLSFSDPTVARIEPSTLVISSGMGQSVARLIGIAAGHGSVLTAITEGSEFSKSTLGLSSVSVIDTISVFVFLRGSAASNYSNVASDTWSDWELSVSDFVVGYSPTFEITAVVASAANSEGALGVTASAASTVVQYQASSAALINLSTSRITISFPPSSYSFRIASASFSPATIVLSVRAPQRPEFREVNVFRIGVVPLSAMNLSSVPARLTIGRRNTKVAFIGTLGPPSEVMEVLIDTSKCNGSVASVSPFSPLTWTPDVHGQVGVAFVGKAEGTCEVMVTKVSDIFHNQIVYLKRQIIVAMPPVIDAVNSTNSVAALRNRVSVFSSLIGSAVGGSGSAGGTTPQYYTGAGRGENITFLFQTIRSEVGTVGIVSKNGTFPMNRTTPFLVRVINEGEGSMMTGADADILIVCSPPKEAEIGLVEALQMEEGARVSARVVGAHFVEITFGPMPSLLILSDQILMVSFEASAFVENAYPLEGADSFPVILQRYQPNIVTLADSIVLQVAGHLSVLAAAFGAPIGALTAMQFYQMSWLYDCPQQDVDTVQLPYGITAQRNKDGVDYAVVTSSIFVAFAFVFGGFHLIVVSGFYIQRKESSTRTFLELAGRFFFPGATFIAVYFVAQFATHYAFLGVFTSEVVGHRVAAFILVAVPLGFVLTVIHGVVWRGKSLTFLSTEVVYRDKIEKERKRRMAQKHIIEGHRDGGNGSGADNGDGGGVSCLDRVKLAFRPKGFWVHPTDPYYVRRWGILFSDMSGGYKWVVLVYFGASIALGILTGYQPVSNAGCVGRTAAISGVHGLLALATFFWRPYQYGFISLAFFLAHSLQLISTAILAAELRADVRNDTLQMGSLRALIAGDIILLLALFVRALIGCLAKVPPRDELLRICEESGINTTPVDYTVEHLKTDNGSPLFDQPFAYPTRRDDAASPILSSGFSNMFSSTSANGNNRVPDEALLLEEDSLAKSVGLQGALLASPSVNLADLDIDEGQAFASGYPHHEDPDLYGQYAPVFVAEPLRGGEHAFSPSKKAELLERQRLTRKRLAEQGLTAASRDADDGRHVWLDDVVERTGTVPLSAWGPHPRASQSSNYIDASSRGARRGGAWDESKLGEEMELKEHQHNYSHNGNRNNNRMIEKRYGQYSRNGGGR